MESPEIQYLVEFNELSSSSTNKDDIRTFREIWSGSKARRYSVDKIPPLLSGYSYKHLDIICGLTQGYSQWGWTWESMLPWCSSKLNPLYLDVGLAGRELKQRRSDDMSQIITILGDNNILYIILYLL
jgi:hypothetical protein